MVITGTLVMAWSLMLSQAMESVTRAFYARGDLDLILTSPATASRLFAVRIVAMAVTIVVHGAGAGARRSSTCWSGAAERTGLARMRSSSALAMDAVAVAVVLTVALFRAIGPRRTRVIAQIVAAVIGAAFAIAVQFAAILSFGTMSRMAMLQSPTLVRLAPDARQPVLVAGPRRARRAGGAGRLCSASASLRWPPRSCLFAPRFGQFALAAGSVSHGTARRSRRPARFHSVVARRRRCAARSGRCCCAIPG